MIKEAFIDSYQLLTSNVKFKMDDFIELMRTSSRDTNREKELEKLNSEHKNLIAKKLTAPTRIIPVTIIWSIPESSVNLPFKIIQNRNGSPNNESSLLVVSVEGR